ncbi:MAG: DUF1800 family protein, partial [Ignavibacteriales bacterium]|nr:DUF1800 family protein [Ignavibacteriales bacterium]
SDQFKATSIKTPNHLIVGVMKQFNISGLSPLDYYFIIESSDKMKQLHFDPPDVRGWEGQRKWISTTTLPMRNEFTDSIISGNNSKGNPIGFSMNVLEFARSFESSEDAVQFVEDVINYLFIYPLSQNTKGRMLEKLLDGAVIQDWSTYSNQAETRIINFLKALARLPEYQLS